MIPQRGRVVQKSRRLVTTLLLFGLLPGCSPADVRHRFEHRAMGTRFLIVIEAPSGQEVKDAALAAFERIDELDGMMSSFKPQSELRRLCREAVIGSPSSVAGDLCQVLIEGQRIFEASGGAFDVTVGPLVRLWRRAIERGRPPSARAISDVQGKVGAETIAIDRASREVTFSRAGVEIDLGGIAKGYAVGQALDVIVRCGFLQALVDGGGDIAISSSPTARRPWRVGLAPLSTEGVATVFIEVRDGAVATSGDAFQFLEHEGRRYSHVLDPRSGWGVEGPTSVTVVAPDAAVADALATALSVLGPERGRVLLEGFSGCGAAYFLPGEDPLSAIVLGDFPALQKVRMHPGLELEPTPCR